MIKHLDGICHVFIDNEVHIEKAFRIAINAKTQHYGTYNTMETLLVHTAAIAENILPVLVSKYKQLDMELQGCYKVIQILKNMVFPAIESDWKEEYLALILSIKIVNSLDEAINHINRYGSHHTDSIISNNYGNILGSSSKLTLSVLW